MSTSKFTVAICGGGIAGLTTAISISRHCLKKDIKIDVYEAAQALTPTGAGVTFWRRPWGVMKALDLQDDLMKICQSHDTSNEPRLAFQYRKSDQVNGIHFYDMNIPTAPFAFHRAEFLDCLANNVDREATTLHFGKRLTNFVLPTEPTAPIILEFKDGSQSSCDVLIGADGIHSATRSTLLELAAQDSEACGSENGKKTANTLRDMKEPVWSGHTAYRTVANTEKLKKLNPKHRTLTTFQIYCGKGKHIAAYPIARGKFVSIAAFHSWPEKVGTKYNGKMLEEHATEDLVSGYEGWEAEVIQLLQCVERPSRWVLTVLDGLPIYTHGRTVLIGDAAHAMTPHQGSGAGQALEDAYVLGSLLGHSSVTLASLPVALKVYEQIRLPFANEVQRRSAEAAWRQSFQDPMCSIFDAANANGSRECTADDVGRLWEIGHASAERLKWNWTTTIEDDRAQAMKILEEQLEHSNAWAVGDCTLT